MVLRLTVKELIKLGFVDLAKEIHTPEKKKKSGYEHIKSGFYVVGGKRIFLRSKYEYTYVLYLQFLKDKKKIKDWEYEPKLFIFEKIKHGTNCYKPDFKITENDGSTWWAEVKGVLDSKSKTKLSRMKKYYPKEKVVLITGKQIRAIRDSGILNTLTTR